MPKTKTETSSEELTDCVRVKVVPAFLPKESSPEQERFLFSYQVTIENERATAIQLISRHWIIIDANGKKEEVQGPGVVGETPLIEPGQSYTYSSYCSLSTNWGTMEGFYDVLDEDDEQTFKIKIGRFYLISE